ncbi:hypothetical protein NECAME_04187 [Necator americanus]|uniref:Dual specificity/tyrosine protein phosphatase N-terminal domain-containing protein n=1 Tax=Necator americanus TaxID=51031 RepID=W2SYI5_NECAM|nr:hypothetical protein NECAME_04187 [Necator americanus]ETN73966.1 hypothetical protein NECAME_04187 [Necator americanus]
MKVCRNTVPLCWKGNLKRKQSFGANIKRKVHYEPFYGDFGPLNLSVLYRFTRYLNGLIETQRKRKIVVYTDSDERNRVNGAYIMASYLVTTSSPTRRITIKSP